MHCHPSSEWSREFPTGRGAIQQTVTLTAAATGPHTRVATRAAVAGPGLQPVVQRVREGVAEAESDRQPVPQEGEGVVEVESG
jgi:hypothetical protein